MNTVRSNNSLERATAEWRLNVVPATITGLVVCVALVLNVLTLFLGDDFLREPSGERVVDYPLAAAGMVAALSVIWFWLRMVTDYFRHRPENHSVAWGWALLFLGFIAALAYFWYVWRPRISGIQSANA